MPYHKCKACEKFVKVVKCEFRGHDNKCSVCGTCPDCEEYKEKVRRYNDMINDLEYFHEPWDWSDTPESRVPKKPLKRLTEFPGKIKILEVIGPTPSEKDISLIEIIFEVETYAPVACAAGLVGMDKISETFYNSPRWGKVGCISVSVK